MRTECSDLVVSDGGNIVLVSFDQSSISVLTQDEEKITEFDTNPLYPFWITKTMKDEIIVTLIDNGDHYNLLPSSRRVVHLMDLTGDMLHSFEFKEDGKTRLFTLPMKTAENKNTDICVINWFSESSGELVVLHRNGRVKFTHEADAQKVECFLPTDVDCDSKSSILFSEFHSRAIHVLNAKGLYLYKLCQYDQCIVPYAVSVNGDNLWCGMNWGTLKLYKYRN
ncbi:hypothetical protein FSP39_007420 [Pinctada imbricata]|uniref:Uncharacterized protein n=1 Tax=Pinctada imbricata TaxID=66713 RepID=A0AA89C0S2_PINIB|nr:hypothetical protein FSP39_007420 [Pinctada imbricata]